MKKIPYGIKEYDQLILGGYEYIDKTMYLEKLENIGNTLIYLRPGRFGKSLFTSMLSFYYDANSKKDFKKLFGRTYVGSNPTPNKNNYYILKFDFSGLTTDGADKKNLENEFKGKVLAGIENFLKHYSLNIKNDFDGLSISGILLKFLTHFNSLKLNKKIYLIIDEYDNFTNAILEGNADRFMGILGNEGFVKAFYAVIKEYSGNTIDRVFITGICPITLNSMTTGFNIAKDISTDELFVSMIGLTHDEVKTAIGNIIEVGNKDEIFETMVKHYDGYLFSKESNVRMFNATLVMYFLDYYVNHKNTIPKELYDKNIVVNYGKIDNLLKLQNNDSYKETIEEILKTDTIDGLLKTQFNLVEGFTKNDIISLLYYFGYLTIEEVNLVGGVKFRVPNYIMKMTYGNYLLKILSDFEIRVNRDRINDALLEIAESGRIDKITEYVSEVLSMHDSRFFINFDEKYIQSLYFSLLQDNTAMNIYIEYPCKEGYIDLYIEGKLSKLPHDVMIEFKYMKKSDCSEESIEKKRIEGIDQLKKYSSDERIPKTVLKYLVIFVGEEVKLLESVD